MKKLVPLLLFFVLLLSPMTIGGGWVVGLLNSTSINTTNLTSSYIFASGDICIANQSKCLNNLTGTGGTSFVYSNYFNQELNTTNNVSFINIYNKSEVYNKSESNNLFSNFSYNNYFDQSLNKSDDVIHSKFNATNILYARNVYAQGFGFTENISVVDENCSQGSGLAFIPRITFFPSQDGASKNTNITIQIEDNTNYGGGLTCIDFSSCFGIPNFINMTLGNPNIINKSVMGIQNPPNTMRKMNVTLNATIDGAYEVNVTFAKTGANGCYITFYVLVNQPNYLQKNLGFGLDYYLGTLTMGARNWIGSPTGTTIGNNTFQLTNVYTKAINLDYSTGFISYNDSEYVDAIDLYRMLGISYDSGAYGFTWVGGSAGSGRINAVNFSVNSRFNATGTSNSINTLDVYNKMVVSGLNTTIKQRLEVYGNSTMQGNLNVKNYSFFAKNMTFYNDYVWLNFNNKMGIFANTTGSYINTSIAGAKDLTLLMGTGKTLVLEPSVYDDLAFYTSGAKVPPANAPTWQTFTTNTNEYCFNVGDYVDYSAQELPHSWKEGTDGSIHLHMTLNSAQSSGANRYAKFNITIATTNATNYVWTENSASGNLCEATISTGSLALNNTIQSCGTLTLARYVVATQIKVRIKRITATTGTDYADCVFLPQVSFHIEKDTFGSRTIMGK